MEFLLKHNRNEIKRPVMDQNTSTVDVKCNSVLCALKTFDVATICYYSGKFTERSIGPCHTGDPPALPELDSTGLHF